MTKYWIFFGLVVVSSASMATNSIGDNVIEKRELSKSGRFVTFNNQEGEIKIELDFAVPFMKIPVHNKRSGELIQPSLDVNTRGLVTVGAMLFLFVTVVPKIVKLFVPQAHATAAESLSPYLGRIEETLQSMDISTTECYQRSACWVANKASGTYSFANSKSAQWIESFVESDALQEALNRGLNGEDCSQFRCPLSMNTISKIMKMGRSLV